MLCLLRVLPILFRTQVALAVGGHACWYTLEDVPLNIEACVGFFQAPNIFGQFRVFLVGFVVKGFLVIIKAGFKISPCHSYVRHGGGVVVADCSDLG